ADISASVNETGTVNPVDVVQVGSQVSGTIATLNVDYNSKVTKGEVLATLDPTTFRAAVEHATASLEAAQSSAAATQSGVLQAQAQAAASPHQVASSAAQLQQAQYNFSRPVITSPIDGVVMARNVSVGQTVAASFQTPTLFTLATNLTNMQVDTSVDEADVGNVRPGETAHISVTAFPNVTFAGRVQQVRVNPTVVQNVVTYDAVVIVQDASGRLLPGM